MADRTQILILNTAQYEFGCRLRDERERRGLTLKAIADSTKISLASLAALERGDIDHWPCGLFRRGHFRAYAAAVGLSPEPLIVEFRRLFDDEAVPPRSESALTPDGSPRLTLAPDRRWAVTTAGRRALASAVDLCAIFAIATALARILQADFSLACALVGLTYYALATMALGQSVTLWWLNRRVLERTRSSAANVGELLFLLPRRRPRGSLRQQGQAAFRDEPSAPTA